MGRTLMEGQDGNDDDNVGHFLANPDASVFFFFVSKPTLLDDAAAVSSRFLL